MTATNHLTKQNSAYYVQQHSCTTIQNTATGTVFAFDAPRLTISRLDDYQAKEAATGAEWPHIASEHNSNQTAGATGLYSGDTYRGLCT